jgi:tetratricopeptide (TPR) repeat protein
MLTKSSFLVLIGFFFFSVANAQIPNTFTNLKVLPKDISKDELVDIMKSFTSSLGVRCNYCHVGEDGQPLNTFDFQSDTKTTKLKARTMMNMTHDINSDYLSKFSEYQDKTLQVKCVTCHRGIPKPEPLEDVIYEKLKSEGLDEAISSYNDLYKKNYGGYAYDFRDHSLVGLSEKLSEEKLYDEAIAFAKINVEKYPESGVAYFGFAEAYESKGDKENAIKNYKKALELMPRGKDFINKKLEELTK